MEANLEKNELVELTAEIVSAYVSNNTVVATALPGVIHNVFDALSKASSTSGLPAREELKPAIPVKKSVTPEYIICLEDFRAPGARGAKAGHPREEISHAGIHHLPRGR